MAVSGGLDSVVLLKILQRLRPILKYRLVVAYIHHGVADGLQLEYRSKAQKFVKKMAENLELPFYTNKLKKKSKILKSEEDFRNFRYDELAKIMSVVEKKSGETSVLALAHHRDDLLETQMLRLIRGTGVDGLRAMDVYSEEQNKLRPMLGLGRKEILGIAKKMKLSWLEDPSNTSSDPLRNWLRRSWLPALEKKVPGVRSSLARSLTHIASMSSDASDALLYVDSASKSKGVIKQKMILKQKGIAREQYIRLGLKNRRSLVLHYLRALGIKRYTQNQVEEICRRLDRSLDNRQDEYKFALVNHCWIINTQWIKAEKS